MVQLLSTQFPTGLAMSMGGLSLSYGFAVVVGVGFGLYPAWIASRQEPVEALRAS
jgi:ABC-type antimicrobial peptide transport system permease subunit